MTTIRLPLLICILTASVACAGSRSASNAETPAADPVPSTAAPEAGDPEASDPEATDPEATDPEAGDPEATDPEAWVPSEQQAEMLRLLSLRDEAPSCVDVTAGVDDPLGALSDIVVHVQAPPWVGMRAAGCLIQEHGDQPEAVSLMTTWVTDPELAGLGLLVLNRLDTLSAETAAALAKTAIADGPDAEKACTRAAKSTHAEVQAVVAADCAKP